MTRTVAELAQIARGELHRGDGNVLVSRLAPTDAAGDDAITFLSNPKYLDSLAVTSAAAVLLQAEHVSHVPEKTAVILVKNPYAAFARVAQALLEKIPQPAGVHASAVIEGRIGKDVSIGPFVYVAEGATVATGAVLYAGVHVEAGASVGAGSVLYDHVVVRHGCVVGPRCILHPGVVVGSDGFGFAQDDGEHVKIPQVGDVCIEEDVEIGANSCIDRGALGTTRIGAGSKIDNLVQVGHNVEIGPRCIVVSQAGIAGSSRLGPSVIVAAQAGVAGHVEVGEGARILGQAGVRKSVQSGESVVGTPAEPERSWARSQVYLRKLDSLFKRVKKLERLLPED